MKYFKTFEGFKKSYMKKIDLKDFKKIKKGSKIMYMGGEAEVIDNNGYILTLKKDGRKFTVNKSMFDHGGMIREGVMINEGLDLVEQIIFMIILAANVYDGSISKPIIKYFKNRKEIKKIVKRVSANRDLVAAAKSKDDSKFYELLRDTLTDAEFDTLFKVGANYDKVQRGVARESVNEGWGKAPDADKAMRDLKRKGSQIDWLDDADDATKKIWKKAGVNPEDENTVILYSYVSHQWDDAKKILKKYNVDFKELEDPNSAGESFIVFVKESKVIEAAHVPSNISDFAKRRGRLRDVKQIARWAEKAGLGIRGGTAIGKGYDTLVLDLTYNGAEIYFDLDTGIIKVNRQPVNSWKTFSKAVNESSERDGTEASDGKHKHDDHLEEDIEAMWKKAYGEKFATKYPGVAKILRQRKITDKREVARIWQETYGENFKEEYPAMWDMMSK